MGRIRKIGSAHCNYSQILYQFLTFTQNLKRSLLSRHFSCTRKFRWNSLVHKKARPANDAHSRDEEVCRKRPRSARECAKAHSYLHQKSPLGKRGNVHNSITFCTDISVHRPQIHVPAHLSSVAVHSLQIQG